MKTIKKIALLALVAIVGYTGYSSAISIKERDMLKKQADALISVTSPNEDQLDKLESILMKLENTQKFNRFARKERDNVMLKLVDLRADEAKAEMKQLKAQLSSSHQQKLQEVEFSLKNLQETNQQLKESLSRLFDENESLENRIGILQDENKELKTTRGNAAQMKQLQEENAQLKTELNKTLDALKLERGDEDAWN